MGTQGQGSNERLRTVWTPEMDRYFIDLMLEQVQKGNRFDDHLFSKRAWKHMSSLFTARFKFPYGKDVLKNRHKTLRNLHRTVKNLLDQEGFSWDERRQMVTADNNVWDEYLKVHPDARSFRIKSIPNYADLCLIYGGGTADQRGNIESSSASYLVEGTINAVTQPDSSIEGAAEILNNIPSGEDYRISEANLLDDTPNSVSTSKGTSRVRTSWHPPMDRYFIDLMLDQVSRGNQIEGVFRKQAWVEMITSFNARFGFDYEVDVLKNRYKTLKRQYNIIKNLLLLDGFVWDDARQMVTADDSVWQDYIKAHSDARQFMTRPVPYYKDLCVICNDTSFDDNDCLADMGWFDPETDLQDLKSVGTSGSSQSPAASIFEEKNLLSDSTNKRQPERDLNPEPLKKPRGDEESPVSSSLSIEDAVAAVQALPDMDEELILDACDLLEDEVKAKTFLALDVKLRKKWLLRKLRPQVS